MKRKNLIWIIPAAILGMALFAYLGGQIVMRLWNWLLPALFGIRMITFWQALGVLILCRILFGGLSHGGHGSKSRGRAVDRVADRVAERWDRMTPEELKALLAARKKYRVAEGELLAVPEPKAAGLCVLVLKLPDHPLAVTVLNFGAGTSAGGAAVSAWSSFSAHCSKR